MSDDVARKRMPQCIGNYDIGDLVCDGDPKGASEHERMPCYFRDRCAALKQHCSFTGREPSEYVKLRKYPDDSDEIQTYAVARGDDAKFVEQLARWIRRWGVRNGRVTRRTPAADSHAPPRGRKPPKFKDARLRTPPSADARRKARAAIAAKAEESLAEAYKLAAWFTKCLQDATGLRISERAASAAEGELLIVDRMSGSRYLAVYCSAKDGQRHAIASVYPSTRSGEVQVRFPVEPAAFKGVSRFEIFPIKDGKFKSRSGKLDKEGAARAAEVIASLIQRGTINLRIE